MNEQPPISEAIKVIEKKLLDDGERITEIIETKSQHHHKETVIWMFTTNFDTYWEYIMYDRRCWWHKQDGPRKNKDFMLVQSQ